MARIKDIEQRPDVIKLDSKHVLRIKKIEHIADAIILDRILDVCKLELVKKGFKNVSIQKMQ